MNYELNEIIKEMSESLKIKSEVTNVNSVYDIKYYNPPREKERLIKKYENLTISEIIQLKRIDELYEEGIISSEVRKDLLISYKDYKVLNNVIGMIELEVLFGENNTNTSKEDYFNMIIKREALEQILNEYGILDSFDYEEAFLNQINKEIRGRYLTKKNSTK